MTIILFVSLTAHRKPFWKGPGTDYIYTDSMTLTGGSHLNPGPVLRDIFTKAAQEWSIGPKMSKYYFVLITNLTRM